MRRARLRPSVAAVLTLAGLTLAGCGEAVKDDHFARDVKEARSEPAPVRPGTVPVRIGELGPSFDACGAVGTTRHLNAEAGDRLPVRAAPFDNAEAAGTIAAGARFFICARSHDQRWLGVVYDSDGTLAPRCGVSRPAASRQDYDGPCPSGWVFSAFVKQVAG